MSIVISCLADHAAARSPTSITLKPSVTRSRHRGRGRETAGGIETRRRTGEVVPDPDAVESELLGLPRRGDDLGRLAGPEWVKAR